MGSAEPPNNADIAARTPGQADVSGIPNSERQRSSRHDQTAPKSQFLGARGGHHIDRTNALGKSPKTFNGCGTLGPGGSGKSFILTRAIKAAGDCLVINASNITIDLGGCRIQGDGTDTDIRSQFGAVLGGVVIKKGTVTGFTHGIQLDAGIGGAMEVTEVDQVKILDNVNTGVSIGLRGTISNSVAGGNGTGGIFARSGSTIVSTVVQRNGASNSGDGIDRTAREVSETGGASIRTRLAGSQIVGNVITNNGEQGIEPEEQGHLIEDITVRSNALNGIVASEDSATIRDKAVTGNSSEEIVVQCPLIVMGNLSRLNENPDILLGGGCETGSVANLP